MRGFPLLVHTLFYGNINGLFMLLFDNICFMLFKWCHRYKFHLINYIYALNDVTYKFHPVKLYQYFNWFFICYKIIPEKDWKEKKDLLPWLLNHISLVFAWFSLVFGMTSMNVIFHDALWSFFSSNLIWWWNVKF